MWWRPLNFFQNNNIWGLRVSMETIIKKNENSYQTKLKKAVKQQNWVWEERRVENVQRKKKK